MPSGGLAARSPCSPRTSHHARHPQEKKEKKPAGGKDGGGAPGVADVEGASIEELNQKVVTLEREKNKEEEYRNYMQLERVGSLRPCAPG
jgi:hypothetical protein